MARRTGLRPNTLIARKGYNAAAIEYGGPGGRSSGLAGWWDDTTSFLGNVVGGLAKQQQGVAAQNQGVAASQAQMDLQQAYAAQSSSGPSMTDLLLIGGAGAALYFLVLKKKK